MPKGAPPVRPERRRLQRRCAGCAATAALLSSAWPAVCSADTLLDAIRTAYETNPQLRAERAQLRATDEGYVQARSGFGPQVSANAGISYDSARIGQATGAVARGTTGTAALSAVQPLFTSGAVRAQVDTASANIAAGREQLRQVEAQVLLDVVTAYEDVRRDRQTLAILQEQIAAIDTEYRDTEARQRAGALTMTDVAQSQARLVATKAQFALAQGRLEASTAAYRNVVGQSPGDLEAAPPLTGAPATVEEAFDVAERESPRLLAAMANEQASVAQVRRAKAASGPTVSLQMTAGATPNPFSTQTQYNAGVAVGAVVSKPLFTSGLNRSRVRESLELSNRARLDIETQRREIMQQIARDWSRVVATRGAMQFQQRQVELQTVAAQGNRIEGRAGLRTTIDLLNAELELSNAKLALLQSRHDAYVAEAALLADVGRLEARYLGPDAAPTARLDAPTRAPAQSGTGKAPTVAQGEVVRAPQERPVVLLQKVSSPAPTTPPPALPADANGRVQIGALASDALARGAWREIAQLMPEEMARASLEVEKAQVNGKTYFRSYVGGFPTTHDAEVFCGKLRSAGRGCIVR